MRLSRLLAAVVALGSAACAVYPADRDTTQPDKILKSSLVCQDPKASWATC
ncbi:MAG: hypothetical protein RL199_2220, partial [Pseudomonadota bacterium]